MKLTLVTAAPAGIYLAFAGALCVWHVAASLLGVVIADRLGVGDGVVDLKSDLKKMSLCSLIALSLFFSLFYFAQHPAVFMVYLLVFMISLKVAYLGANHGFLLVVVGCALAGLIAFAPVVRLLRLPGMFFLYLVCLAAFLVRQRSKKRLAKVIKEIEMRKEREIRDQVRRNPDFTTFCYQCLFYRQGIHRCLLQLDGKEVHNITLNQKTYCTSFQPSPANK
jgi:hypothetical protein